MRGPLCLGSRQPPVFLNAPRPGDISTFPWVLRAGSTFPMIGRFQGLEAIVFKKRA